MTVVKGDTELVRSSLEDEELADRLGLVNDRIGQLIELGEKARELEEIVEIDDTMKQRNVPAILDEIVDAVKLAPRRRRSPGAGRAKRRCRRCRASDGRTAR